MKKNYVILFIVMALQSGTRLQAQRFDSTLKKLYSEYRQEKLYLHFDRNVFYPGETIWFKAYVFAGNFPSLISEVMYADLVDAKGNVLQHKILPVVLSGAAGSFELPEVNAGTLFVRAYTKWMLNFDSSFLFTKAITLLSPGKQLPLNKTQLSLTPVLDFFPEGGDMVQNIESRIAFKATDHNGIPIVISGDIITTKGKKITSFESVHDGMGIFFLNPEIGEQYKAVYMLQGKSYETLLPSAKQNGIVLQVSNRVNEIEFTIKRAAEKVIYPYVCVVAQMHGQLLYRGKAMINKNATATSTMSIKNFPPGIIQLTVFDPRDLPIAERIVFANLSSCANPLGLTISEKDLGPRKKNVVEMDVPDTIPANFSISITDADILSSHGDDNIYSGLLLTSDIKGYVHNPSYYFSGYADSIASHLDLVMMTNGWRRFNWEELLANHFPAIKNLPENYISIEGQLNTSNKNLFAEQEINGILEFKDRKKQFFNAGLQPNGKFSFPGLVFFDTAKLYVHLNKDKKTSLSKATLDINSSLITRPLYFQPDSYLRLGLVNFDTSIIAGNNFIYQRQQKEILEGKTNTLKTVVITTKQKTKQELVDQEYTSGAFADGPNSNSRIILPDDDPAFLASENLIKYLERSSVAGLQINTEVKENPIVWRGSPTALFVDEISQQALSFTDGHMVEDGTFILNLSMSEIAMVKIFEPPFFGAWNGGAGGAISVYLKKPATGNEVKDSEFTTIPGFTQLKEFYSPDYSNAASTTVPDYRRTIYWNPFVTSDKDHRHISFTFYNNDVTKKVKVVIEGSNEDGKLMRVEKIIQ